MPVEDTELELGTLVLQDEALLKCFERKRPLLPRMLRCRTSFR